MTLYELKSVIVKVMMDERDRSESCRERLVYKNQERMCLESLEVIMV